MFFIFKTHSAQFSTLMFSDLKEILDIYDNEISMSESLQRLKAFYDLECDPCHLQTPLTLDAFFRFYSHVIMSSNSPTDSFKDAIAIILMEKNPALKTLHELDQNQLLTTENLVNIKRLYQFGYDLDNSFTFLFSNLKGYLNQYYLDLIIASCLGGKTYLVEKLASSIDHDLSLGLKLTREKVESFFNTFHDDLMLSLNLEMSATMDAIYKASEVNRNLIFLKDKLKLSQDATLTEIKQAYLAYKKEFEQLTDAYHALTTQVESSNPTQYYLNTFGKFATGNPHFINSKTDSLRKIEDSVYQTITKKK